jgi:hypothetical protein
VAALPERVANEVPFFAQEAYQCGPAALPMALGWSGVEVAPETLEDEVFVTGWKGSFALGLVAASRSRICARFWPTSGGAGLRVRSPLPCVRSLGGSPWPPPSLSPSLR